MFRRMLTAVVVAAVPVFYTARMADAVEVDPPLENRITRALTVKRAVDFRDVPLRQTLKELSAIAKVPIVVDDAGLQDEGVDPETPILLKRSEQTLAVTLRDILQPLLLTTVPREEWLEVTTIAKADEAISTRVFDVSKVVGLLQKRLPAQQGLARNLAAMGHAQFGSGEFVPHGMLSTVSKYRMQIGSATESKVPTELILLAAILECGSGQWEQVDGVGGTFENQTGRLIIRQTWKAHQEIIALLAAIEAMLSDPQHPLQLQAGQSEEDRGKLAASQKTLAMTTKYPAGEVSLQTWIDAYLKDNGVAIYVDHAGLQDEGIDWSSLRINVMPGISRGALLQAALESTQTILVPDAGRYIVTTTAHSEELFETVVYDVSAVPQADDVPWLQTMLNEATSGQWEQVDGVGGTVSALGTSGLVAIRQTAHVHTEIAQVFASLRRPLEVAPPANAPAVTTSVYALPNDQTRIDLLRLLPKVIDLPDVTWPEGSVETVGNALVIRQTEPVHQQIETIVDAIQKAHTGK